MINVEERVAFLEGRVVEQSNTLGGIRETMASLENRLERRLESLEQSLSQRLQALEASVSQRFERVDQRFDALDTKMSRQFMWLAGMLLTTLVAVVAALVTR